MDNSWRPDWREENNYPAPNFTKTSRPHFAWEFLRRNLQYQRDYATVAAGNDALARVSNDVWGIRQFIDPSIAWCSQIDGISPSIHLRFRQIVCLLNQDDYFPMTLHRGAHLSPGIGIRECEAVLIVDLSQPVGAILDALKQRLIGEGLVNPKRRTYDPADLIQRLRILDYHHSLGNHPVNETTGEPFDTETVSHLIPSAFQHSWIRTLRDVLSEAQELSATGYLHLGQDQAKQERKPRTAEARTQQGR